jgi:isocitrate dehydrogenase (NAD+)
LYGNILTNIGSGLIGGPGVVPGANIGRDYVVFEPGCRHVGLDLEGLNKANPTSLILSAIHMLRHLNYEGHAVMIYNALMKVITESKVVTADLGGSSSTSEFTAAVIRELK